MPVIAYQSFNANASYAHDLSGMSRQNLTIQTNKRIIERGDRALVMPLVDGNTVTAVEGPAELVKVAPLTDPHTIELFGAQISLVWQTLYRSFGKMPDIMACGELDASHADFKTLIIDPAVTVKPTPSAKACQSFTTFSQTRLSSAIEFLTSGEGFVAYRVGRLTVLFVHVPNKWAGKQGEAQKFYRAIGNLPELLARPIHLVIGDTNQKSQGFTAEALNAAFNATGYVNAHLGLVSNADNYMVTERGTNSVGTKMFDVVVYRADLARLVAPVVYYSQSSGAVTVTDHGGLCVEIEVNKRAREDSSDPSPPAKRIKVSP